MICSLSMLYRAGSVLQITVTRMSTPGSRFQCPEGVGTVTEVISCWAGLGAVHLHANFNEMARDLTLARSITNSNL